MNVLLLSAEGVQAVCMARWLHRAGHRVYAFAESRVSSGYASRWIDERHIVPSVNEKREEFTSCLRSFLSRNKMHVIIPLDDSSAEYLSHNKPQLVAEYNVKCAVPDEKVFDTANDKSQLLELCEAHNIPSPRTRSIDTENVTLASDYVGFPAMIKPNLSEGARGIVRVENADDVRKKLPDIISTFGPCTLQEYVVQPDFYYNVMLYRSRSGRIEAYTIIKIRRFFPLRGGSSCYSETVEEPELLHIASELLESLNYIGFADLDVLVDKRTGEFRIIEINPRVPSSLQAAAASGIDFSAIMIADEFGEVIPRFTYRPGQQVRWFGLDVMWFLFSPRRFSFSPSWFRFWGKNVSYHDGSWRDPLPMIAGCLEGVVKYMNPAFRRSKLNK